LVSIVARTDAATDRVYRPVRNTIHGGGRPARPRRAATRHACQTAAGPNTAYSADTRAGATRLERAVRAAAAPAAACHGSAVAARGIPDPGVGAGNATWRTGITGSTTTSPDTDGCRIADRVERCHRLDPRAGRCARDGRGRARHGPGSFYPSSARASAARHEPGAWSGRADVATIAPRRLPVLSACLRLHAGSSVIAKRSTVLQW